MDIIKDVLLNYYLLSFVVAWLMTVFIKAYIKSREPGKSFNLLSGIETGGMPSSHSAVVTAITVAVLLKEGFSTLFFVSGVFAMIIISDAFGLRQNVGLQAEALNRLLEKSKEKCVKVAYGHTFIQVIIGICLGAIVPVIFYFIL